MASGVVLALAPFGVRWILGTLRLLVAMFIVWVTTPSTGETLGPGGELNIVIRSGLWMWFRARAMGWVMTRQNGPTPLGSIDDFFAARVPAWEAVGWAAMAAVLVLVTYGAAYSILFRRRHLHQAEVNLTLDKVLPPAGTIGRAISCPLLMVTGTYASLYLMRQLAEGVLYFQVGPYISTPPLGTAFQRIVRVSMHVVDWMRIDNPLVLSGLSVLAVTLATTAMARVAIIKTWRGRGRACPKCAYPSVGRGRVCPECGTTRTTMTRRRFLSTRLKKRSKIVLVAAIVLAGLEAVSWFAIDRTLVRVRISPWWLRTMEGRRDSEIELARLRLPRNIAIVPLNSQIAVHRVGSDSEVWQVVFRETPLKAIAWTITGPDGIPHEYTAAPLDSSQPNPIPQVSCGDINMMLVPRTIYGQTDDVPSGSVAVGIYDDIDIQLVIRQIK